MHETAREAVIEVNTKIAALQQQRADREAIADINAQIAELQQRRARLDRQERKLVLERLAIQKDD